MPARYALAIIEAMLRDVMEGDEVDRLLTPPSARPVQDMDEVRAAIILAGGEVLA